MQTIRRVENVRNSAKNSARNPGGEFFSGANAAAYDQSAIGQQLARLEAAPDQQSQVVCATGESGSWLPLGFFNHVPLITNHHVSNEFGGSGCLEPVTAS